MVTQFIKNSFLTDSLAIAQGGFNLGWLGDLAECGVIVTDAELNICIWNSWLETCSGLRSASVIGRNLLDIYPEIASRKFDRFYDLALNGQFSMLPAKLRTHLIPLTSKVKDRNVPMVQQVSIGPLPEETEAIGTVTFIQDITRWTLLEGQFRNQLQTIQQKLQVEQLENQRQRNLLHLQALHDPLTQLPNRACFLNYLNQAIRQDSSSENDSECHKLAIIFLDIDRFHLINESLGYQFGDQLLMELVQRFQSRLGKTIILARLANDEFAFILENVQDETEALDFAKQLQELSALPFQLNNQEVVVTASIGIAFRTELSDRADNLIRNADIAMHLAQVQGRSQIVIFDPMMHGQAVCNLRLEIALRRAINRQELLLDYQPIICLKTGHILGFEALVRWQHPDRGLIPPSAFLPLAEETRLILEIDRWALQTACYQMIEWQTKFPQFSELTISVNLSAQTFAQLGLCEMIQKLLKKTGLTSHCLKLEITETAFAQNPTRTAETLTQLQEMGLGVYLDDFGSGHSSLSYLNQFALETLKIDRGFIQGLQGDKQKYKIVRTVLKLAQDLNLTAIAEGIETAEQLAQLKLLGYEQGQGFFFSKPLSNQDATAFLASCDQWWMGLFVA